MSDPYETPEFAKWARRVRAELIPKLTDSAIVASLVPKSEPDIKYAVELGLSIMLDKPILAIVQPGTQVPPKLEKVADRIIEVDLEAPGGPAKAHAAMQAFLDEYVVET